MSGSRSKRLSPTSPSTFRGDSIWRHRADVIRREREQERLRNLQIEAAIEADVDEERRLAQTIRSELRSRHDSRHVERARAAVGNDSRYLTEVEAAAEDHSDSDNVSEYNDSAAHMDEVAKLLHDPPSASATSKEELHTNDDDEPHDILQHDGIVAVSPSQLDRALSRIQDRCASPIHAKANLREDGPVAPPADNTETDVLAYNEEYDMFEEIPDADVDDGCSYEDHLRRLTDMMDQPVTLPIYFTPMSVPTASQARTASHTLEKVTNARIRFAAGIEENPVDTDNGSAPRLSRAVTGASSITGVSSDTFLTDIDLGAISEPDAKPSTTGAVPKLSVMVNNAVAEEVSQCKRICDARNALPLGDIVAKTQPLPSSVRLAAILGEVKACMVKASPKVKVRISCNFR
jgi:hypothetical protein